MINFIVSGAARNMNNTGKNEDENERNALYDYWKMNRANGGEGDGMVHVNAPAIKSAAQSPTAQISQVSGLTIDQQKQVPVIGQALKGEEQMLRNVTPASGAYVDPKSLGTSYKDIMSKLYGRYASAYGGR